MDLAASAQPVATRIKAMLLEGASIKAIQAMTLELGWAEPIPAAEIRALREDMRPELDRALTDSEYALATATAELAQGVIEDVKAGKRPIREAVTAMTAYGIGDDKVLRRKQVEKRPAPSLNIEELISARRAELILEMEYKHLKISIKKESGESSRSAEVQAVRSEALELPGPQVE